MYSVRLTLAPVWNGDTVGSVAVRLVFDLPVRAGEPLFRIRTRSIDKPFAALDGFEAAIEQAREEFERLQEHTENEKEEN